MQSNSFKGKVLSTALKYREETRRSNKELFAQRYNRLKVFEFPPVEKINMEQHFYIPKGFIGLPNLQKSDIAVYPVICSRADFVQDNYFPLSEQNIATMSGLSINTVNKGIEGLTNYNLNREPLLHRKMISEGQRHFYVYRIGFVRQEMLRDWYNSYLIFHRCIIDSAVWSKLSGRARALYLAMRSVAKFDWYEYVLEYDIDYVDPDEISELYGEEYKNREWDVCYASLSELCRLAKIERTNINGTIAELDRFKLAEEYDSGFKVYLKPKIRDY